ncbi:MAG: tRNA (adenosine(37)-N6)-threonylcarbamoyltransferase complex transferase subunit TsaD [Oscillospiraceae bacterium]|nr:tRNA (adenosine(37)-N6)-threonylcarbamoyltransferase complex transferase subunit TsaD [Oscillospiraceae bacterium]
MNILAIETSCDETAAAVVRDGRFALSGVVASQVAEHALYGGVVPEIAGRRHAESVLPVTRRALEEAFGRAETGKDDAGGGTDAEEKAPSNSALFAIIDAMAVTAAPGLIGALLVGVNFAKALAFSLSVPLIPVHHLRGHVAANYLCFPDLKPPFVALIVSGGHSHIVHVEDYTRYRVLARTRDDAAGECFDKAARAMGLPYPGGPHLSALAAGGDAHAFSLPRPKVDGAPLDFSFSGLKTAVLNILHTAEQKGQTVSLPDLAASFEETVTDILADHARQAMEMTGADTLVLAGGVAANTRLRAKLPAALVPPPALCGDNAAMIGAQAYYEFLAGHTAGEELNAAAGGDIEQFGM